MAPIWFLHISMLEMPSRMRYRLVCGPMEASSPQFISVHRGGEEYKPTVRRQLGNSGWVEMWKDQPCFVHGIDVDNVQEPQPRSIGRPPPPRINCCHNPGQKKKPPDSRFVVVLLLLTSPSQDRAQRQQNAPTPRQHAIYRVEAFSCRAGLGHPHCLRACRPPSGGASPDCGIR
jgi:hypothetical protein